MCDYWVTWLQKVPYHSSIKTSLFHFTFVSATTPTIVVLLTTFWIIFPWRLNLGKLSPQFSLTLKIHIKHLVLQCQFICLQHKGNHADYWFTHEYHNVISPYNNRLMISQASNRCSNHTGQGPCIGHICQIASALYYVWWMKNNTSISITFLSVRIF